MLLPEWNWPNIQADRSKSSRLTIWQTEWKSGWLIIWQTEWKSGWLTIWQVEWKIRLTDNFADWTRFRLTDNQQSDCKSHWLTDWLTIWQTERKSGWMTDNQADWQTIWQTNQQSVKDDRTDRQKDKSTSTMHYIIYYLTKRETPQLLQNTPKETNCT